jgi:hypothetical protein
VVRSAGRATPRRKLLSADALTQVAISFMNEMRVASSALAAYFVISALGLSISRMGAPVRQNGSYSSRITLKASGRAAPMTTRSGFMKSSMAAPSFMNSGFETTSNSCFAIGIITSRTRRCVPTGTVSS